MIKLEAFENKTYFFPLSFLILHVLSYATYFFLENTFSSGPWFTDERSDIINLLFFRSVNLPNFAGLFIVYFLIYKKRYFKTAFIYFFSIYCEQFLIGADYLGSFDGYSLANADYQLFLTDVTISGMDNGNNVIHFSLFTALAHLGLIAISSAWRKYVVR
jgi:hypothetical protein